MTDRPRLKTNKKYYCTNANKQMDAINSDHHSHILVVNGDDRNVNPAVQFVVP